MLPLHCSSPAAEHNDGLTRSGQSLPSGKSLWWANLAQGLPMDVGKIFTGPHCSLGLCSTPSFAPCFYRCHTCIVVWWLSLTPPHPSTLVLHRHLPEESSSHTSNPVSASASRKTRTNLQRYHRSVLSGKTSAPSRDYPKCKAHPIITEVRIVKVRDKAVFVTE